MLGQICFYANAWGFIRPDEDLPDIYFHRTGVQGSIHRKLVPELTVEFDVAERQGKPIAVNIRIPNSDAALREIAGELLGGPAPSKDGGAQ